MGLIQFIVSFVVLMGITFQMSRTSLLITCSQIATQNSFELILQNKLDQKIQTKKVYAQKNCKGYSILKNSKAISFGVFKSKSLQLYLPGKINMQ